jgi:hypothetical protein
MQEDIGQAEPRLWGVKAVDNGGNPPRLGINSPLPTLPIRQLLKEMRW